MVDETAVNDIRRLLKTFGVQADTAIMEHLQEHPELQSLHLRILLEDLTEYHSKHVTPLNFTVEGKVHRGS